MMRMWVWIALAIGVIFGVRTKKSHASSRVTGGKPVTNAVYNLDFWDPLIAARLAFHPTIQDRPGIRAFARAWNNFESDGGNPCAYGDPPPAGTAVDGQPLEIGLGQLYNPDDINRIAPYAAKLGITLSSKALRAYCVPGTQTVKRELTPDELIAQVEGTLLIPIEEGIVWADQMLQKCDLSWNEVDTWKLVKAHHAYPPILNLLGELAKVGKKPSSWAEYRTMLNAIPAYAPDKKDPNKVTDRNPQGYVHVAMHRGFEMCEKCGNATVDAVKGVV